MLACNKCTDILKLYICWCIELLKHECQYTDGIAQFQGNIHRVMATTHKMHGSQNHMSFHLMGFILMGKEKLSLLSSVHTQTDCKFIYKCSNFCQHTPEVYRVVFTNCCIESCFLFSLHPDQGTDSVFIQLKCKPEMSIITFWALSKL